MRCQICRKTTSEVGVKEFGVKGIWRCTEHLPSEFVFDDGILNVNFSTGIENATQN